MEFNTLEADLFGQSVFTRISKKLKAIVGMLETINLKQK